MGRQWMRAIEHAGLRELAERALFGRGLGPSDLARLSTADVLLLAGLADAVRARHRGDEVRVLDPRTARSEPDLCALALHSAGEDGPTGQEILLEVARARLRTPAERGIAVEVEQIGLELAQAALAFGADAVICDLGSKRTLPLLEGPSARRQELSGLFERAGRRVRFVEPDAGRGLSGSTAVREGQNP